MQKTTGTPSYVTVLPGEKGTIVLLHGFLSSKKYWQKVASHLHGEGYRVVMIDLLGFGHAPKPSNVRYDYTDHLEHIHNTLTKLNIQGPIIIAGHSMGALLATRYAKLHPESVKAVGVMNPPIYRSAGQAYRTLRNTGFFYKLLLESRYRYVFWPLLRKLGPFSNHSRESREGSLKHIILHATLAEDLQALQVPGILLIGEKDRRIYLENIREMEFGKNVGIYVESSGHHAPITHNKVVAHHILSLV